MEQISRHKFKEIHLKYVDSDFKKLKKVKDQRDLTWEDLIFFAIINLEKIK